MHATGIIRTSLYHVAACLVASLYGCESPPDSSPRPIEPAESASRATAEPTTARTGSSLTAQVPDVVATPVDARPAALVNGRIVDWGELRPILNEAAGATALQEVILDRLVAEALRTSGHTITEDDVAAERRRLIDSLAPDSDTALRLLDELRSRQGLGPHRFGTLMRRNAALRRLVRDRVQITDAAVQAMYDVKHGPTREARLMVLPTLAAANDAIRRVRAGEPFADVAVECSTDASAARGGLLEPISRSDPSYPEPLRRALWNLGTGGLSDPVLVDNGYAVLELRSERAGDGTSLDDVRPELERLVRLNQERLLMDQLARSFLANVSVTVFDDALHDSWMRSRQRR